MKRDIITLSWGRGHYCFCERRERKDMKRHIIIGKGNYCFCEGRGREKSNEKVYYYKSFKTISNL